jgi:hypothetical protein
MAPCENKKAAAHAFPRGPTPVEDRRMTLELQCREDAKYTSTLKGVGKGRQREGAAIASFDLCENHNQLFQMVDRELVEDGWAPSYMGHQPARM